jgi:hypothetical protein
MLVYGQTIKKSEKLPPAGWWIRRSGGLEEGFGINDLTGVS